eukprot:TRINITY_DN1696_c0_g1_i1.p1 TRINITY_DN1696_c0_g1~~TRINITY_DN1696_c0_g1_i1.p1  ORF type:complete len:380 (-),score=42.32 TRINITY_DN1696_c0_g1_i1:442-1581(-)
MLRRRQRSSGSIVSSGSGLTETFNDLYGFSIVVTVDEFEDRKYCMEKDEKRLNEWKAYETAETIPRNDTVKKLVRKGIPAHLRERAWLQFSGGQSRQKAQKMEYYQEMVVIGEAYSPNKHQIQLDLKRTFPGHPWVTSDEGQLKLWRVLVAYSVHDQNIGYCQSMNYVAAMLLLAMNKKEESAFWALDALLDGTLYPGLYAANLQGAHVEMRSLQELVVVKLPKLAKHMQENSCDMSLIATDWFLCLYSTSFPSETTCRVWDSLFYEGPKVLFRVALALLKQIESDLLNINDPGELMRMVRNTASKQHNRNLLMKCAFDQIGSLSMARIDNWREAKRQVVDEEMRAREQTKNPSNGQVIKKPVDLLSNDSSSRKLRVFK